LVGLAAQVSDDQLSVAENENIDKLLKTIGENLFTFLNKLSWATNDSVRNAVLADEKLVERAQEFVEEYASLSGNATAVRGFITDPEEFIKLIVDFSAAGNAALKI
jgi:cob(I)alamin adenosyltransferase